MRKRLFVWLAAIFVMALAANAQGNSYSMVIEMANGTKINIGPNDIKNISFIDGKLALEGEGIDDIKKEIATLSAKVDNIQMPDLNSVYAAIEALNAQTTYVNAQIANYQAQIALLQKLADNSQAQIDALQSHVSVLTTEMAALKEQMADNNGNNNGNNNGQGDADYLAKLVGVWQQPYDLGVGVIGIKFTADGKAYYNEWNNWEQPNFDNVVSPASVAVTANTLRITHPMVPGYFEEYRYELNSDGNTVTFSLIDWAKDKHSLGGTFTKLKD